MNSGPIRTELRRIQSKLEHESRTNKGWRALDVLLKPMMSLGLFAIATSLPIIGAGLEELIPIPEDLSGWGLAIGNLVPGGILLIVAYGLFTIPPKIQGYFLEHPDQIQSFLALFGSDHIPLMEMMHWAKERGVDAESLATTFKQAIFVLRTGLLGTMALIYAAISAYFLVVSVLAWKVLGWQIGAFATATVVLGLFYIGSRLWKSTTKLSPKANLRAIEE